MDKIDIKSDMRYVIGAMHNGHPVFMYRDFANHTWHFYENISKASKCTERYMAQVLLDAYKREVDDSRELAILPIEVSYKIIDDEGVVIDADSNDVN